MAEHAIDDYALPEEAVAALERLGVADQLRLRQTAQSRARGLWCIEWEDLLQESLTRIMEGTRRWPRKVPIITFVAGVMRSIASEHWEQHGRIAEAGVVVEADAQPPGQYDIVSVMEAATSNDPGPDMELEAKRELETIEQLFGRDEDALAVVMAKQEGYTRTEILKDFGMTPTQYASTLTRIRRKLLQYGKGRSEQ